MKAHVKSYWELHPKAHLCYYWLPPLLLSAGILILAGDWGSVRMFRLPIIILEYLLPSYSKNEIVELYFLLRKVGHFLAYAFLFSTYARALRWYLKMTRLKSVLLALAICLLLAAGDESWQALHPSRSGKFQDVLLDMSGALTAAAVLFHFLKHEDQRNNIPG